MFQINLPSTIKKIQDYYSVTKKALHTSITNTSTQLPTKQCPHCFKITFGKEENHNTFGNRMCNYIYLHLQSWCKECMNKRKKETLESLNYRRQLNKFFLFLLNIQ